MLTAYVGSFILYSAIPVKDLVDARMLTHDQCDAWNLSVKRHIVILMKCDSDYVEVVNKVADLAHCPRLLPLELITLYAIPSSERRGIRERVRGHRTETTTNFMLISAFPQFVA